MLNAGLRAGDAVSSGDPYASIAARNVFNINPPPPPGSIPEPVETPKITPNGITSTLGHLQALFKVTTLAKPNVPAKELTYILSEGQEQDDIAVIKIDEKAGVVTFNNHGVLQELPLVVANASGNGPTPGRPGPPPTLPGMPPTMPGPRFAPGGDAGGGGFIHFGQRGGVGSQNRGVTMGGNNPNNDNQNGGANGGVNFASSRLGVATGGAGGNTGLQSSQQTPTQLSPEDQLIWMAKLHADALQGKNNFSPNMFIPTPFDQDAGIPPAGNASSGSGSP